MTYALDFVWMSTASGYADIQAQLFNTTGANVGAASSTTFTDLGSGYYLWHAAAIPDGHRGGVKLYRSSASTTMLAISSINPEENESQWSASVRTLTQSAASIAAAAVGTMLTIQRGDIVAINLTGLGNITARTKLYFTAKEDYNQPDSTAILKVEETAGLQVLNGSSVGLTTTDASIAVTNATTGALTLTFKTALTTVLEPTGGLYYDLQIVTANGVTTLTSGILSISYDVTQAII